MKKSWEILFVVLIIGCMRKTPGEPADYFTLYVNNLTTESYEIYVSYYGRSKYMGMAPADSLVELGDCFEDEYTCFEARQGDVVFDSRCDNTIHLEGYTWYLHPR